jgi:hypothetical protein
VCATDPDWQKWRTCDPTSSHWYTIERFERYMAAHIARDQDNGFRGLTVGDFIAELDGLKGTAKRKEILEATGAYRVKLADFFERGRVAIGNLLIECQRATKAPKPEALGLIGGDHLLQDCCKLGAAEQSFQYRKRLIVYGDLPYVIEVGFAYCPDGPNERKVVAGVNSSVAIDDPFKRLTIFDSLSSILTYQKVDAYAPVVFAAHLACPRVDFSDRGKSAFIIPQEVARTIINLVESATKAWTKQRRDEDRHAHMEANRRERLLKAQKPSRPPPLKPEGTLAEIISQAAFDCEVSIKELCVLADNNDPYTAWKRRRPAEWFAHLFHRFVRPGGRRHLRGFFYLLVSHPEGIAGPDGKPFINDYKHWVAMQRAANDARWVGLIPFKGIIDERNAAAEIYVPELDTIATSVNSGAEANLPAAIEAALPSFDLHGFRGRQTHRIIFYGEKSSLIEVLRPIAERIGAEMIIVIGESSNTRIEEAAERLVADGRPGVLLYFSDFDPSGYQMPISVARKLQALRDLLYPNLDIKLYPVALTNDQVRDLGLPSAPLKHKEKRASKWREAFDHDQTEIDALVELYPDVLRQATHDAIAPFYDFDLAHRVDQARQEWQQKADQALAEHPAYQEAVEQIEAAWEAAAEAVVKLSEEQNKAAAALRNAVPEKPELPNAEPRGEAKLALFDSAEDFVTATRRLRQHKRLGDLDDVEEEDADEPA